MTGGSATFLQGPAIPDVSLSAGTLGIGGNSPYTIAGGTWTVAGSSQLGLPGNGAVIASGARLRTVRGCLWMSFARRRGTFTLPR